MNKIKEWLETIMDPDWLLKNAKVISIIMIIGIIVCLAAIFLLQSYTNLQSGPKDITAERNEKIKEQQKTSKEIKKEQQDLISETQTKSFSFDTLNYKAPDTEGTVDSFLDTKDHLISYYQQYLLFSTDQERLYFYNVEDGTTSNVTNLALYSQISNGNLYYVHIEDKYTNRLVKYDIKTKDKKGIITVNPTLQSISGVAERDGMVYYILISSGKVYLQASSLTNPTDKKALDFNIPLPIDSYLKQEGNDIYVINKSGQFILKGNVLEKVSDVPQVEFNDIKVWNGKPLIYGYNSQTDTYQIYYDNKVIFKGEEITEIQPLDETHLLINEHHHLMILNKDSLKTKEIAENIISAVTINGDFIISKSVAMANHLDVNNQPTTFYYFSKTK